MGRPQDALSDLSKATDLDSSLTDELRPHLTACQSPGPGSRSDRTGLTIAETVRSQNHNAARAQN